MNKRNLFSYRIPVQWRVLPSMEENQVTWTLDDNSRASNPGNFRPSLLRLCRHYPLWPAIWGSFLIFSLIMAWNHHWLWWGAAALLLGINLLHYVRLREHFRYGCVNPAVVLSLNPPLIAVASDLTMGQGAYPVIKIISKSLPTANGLPPQTGSRLATVATYQFPLDKSQAHWADFHPRPVDCASGDPAVLEKVMASLADNDWDELISWLKQIPQPWQCGLFHIQPVKS